MTAILRSIRSLRLGTTPMITKRLIQSSTQSKARLVDETIGLMRGKQQPPPAAPVPQPTGLPRLSFDSPLRSQLVRPIEKATGGSRLSQIDGFLLTALNLHVKQNGISSLHTLSQGLKDVEGKMLDIDLKYENEPVDARRINVSMEHAGESRPMTQLIEGEEQDGLVIIAHIIQGASSDEPIVELSSGFAVGDTKEGEGSMIMSVSHTLHSISSKLSPGAKSAAFAITSSAHIYSIDSVLSSFNAADLVVYSLSPQPLKFGSKPITTNLPPKLKSLPISPYPPPSGSPIATYVFTETAKAERNWIFGRIVEYKDAMGRAVETGTYDELATMSCTVVPRAGSSGSPIIDVENGSVIGIMRGAVQGYGDRMKRGFATPAEKIFEMFRLPGFTKAKPKVEPSTNALKASSEKP